MVKAVAEETQEWRLAVGSALARVIAAT